MSRVYCCRISSLGPREVFERPSACEGSCFAGEATLHWVVRQSGKGEVNFALVKFRKFYRRRVMTPLDALGDSFVGGAFSSSPLSPSNLPQTSPSQRATNRLVRSATARHCNAEKSDSYSGGAVIHPMCHQGPWLQ